MFISRLSCKVSTISNSFRDGEAETSLVAQTVKNLPAMQENQVQSLGHEDPLVNGMSTHSSILAWKIPWTEEPGRLQSMVSQRVGLDWEINTSLHICIHHRFYLHYWSILNGVQKDSSTVFYILIPNWKKGSDAQIQLRHVLVNKGKHNSFQ